LFSTNGVVLTLAVAALALSPATVSFPLNVGEAAALATGLLTLLLINLVVMRQMLSPLDRLWQAMRTVDPLYPGERIDVGAQSIEVAELTEAFNAMLDRLENERRESARRTQAAQEDERRRLSRELHDEVGQNLTALLLQIGLVARGAAGPQRETLEACREAARACLDHVRELARGLRPEVLDDLGLQSALANLCDKTSQVGEIRVIRRFAPDCRCVSDDAELVIYRVAQESLTNVLRHAGASQVWVRLGDDPAGVALSVRDDGNGLSGAEDGAGIVGMRERALLIGARLTVTHADRGGTEVLLQVPMSEVRA